MEYNPRPPALLCPCGQALLLHPTDIIEDDTGEHRGAVWQAQCRCNRSYTIEVANDPDYPDD